MANPIKTSDLYQDTGELKKLIAELEQVQQRLKDLRDNEIRNAINLEKVVKSQTAATAAQRDEIEASAKQADEIAKRYKKYNDSLSQNAVELAALKNAQTAINQVNKLEAKLLTEKEGSYNRLSAQYSLNKIRLNQMSKAERETTKEGRELVKQSAELYEEMKRLQEETGKYTLNVGNYRDAIKGLPGPLSQAQAAVDDLGDTMKAVSRNPLLLFLSAVIAAIGLLFNAFTKSEKGAQLFAKATGVINALMSQLVDVAVGVSDAIQNAFENPREALMNFGKLLIDSVVNRLKGAINLSIELGKVISSAISLNLDEMAAAAGRAGQALIQIGTGLDVQQQKDFVDAIKETTNQVIEETNAFIRLEEAKRAVRKTNRELIKSIEQLTTAEELSRSVADDTTKSFAEREAAAEKARAAIEARAQKEIQLARNNLSLINQEIALRRGNNEQVEDLLDRQLDGYRELSAAERQYTLAVRDNERTRSELKQDRLERDLNILIDGFDNQKTVNERLLNDDRLTLEKRREILNETARLADDSFAKQIQTIQQFTGVAINANDLIAESDAVALNQKIRLLGLSGTIEGQLLEIVRERRIVNQDLSEAEVQLAEKTRSERLKSFQLEQELAKAEFELVKRTEAEKAEFLLQQKQAQLQTIQELNEQQLNQLPVIDTAKIESEVNTLGAAVLRARKQTALDAFDQQQELAQSEFNLLRTTEKQKTEFRLQSEKERLQKVLEINDDLSDAQVQIIRNQIQKINGELNKLNRTFGSIWDAFGLDSQQQEAVKSSFNFAKGQVVEMINQNAQLAQQNAQRAQENVENAQLELSNIVALAEQGYSVNVEQARRNLDLQKKNQAEALREQKKAQRAQIAVQSIEQASNLITASSKIWSQLGFPLAIPAIALMWGVFAASKIRALQLTKKTFGGGGLEILGGGSHASGNDTYLGFQSSGKPAYGERNEAVAIIPVKSTKKYMSDGTLPDVIGSLIKGTFHSDYQRKMSSGFANSDNLSIYAQGYSLDMSATNDHLGRISKNTEQHYQVGQGGKIVRRYKNLTTIYES